MKKRRWEGMRGGRGEEREIERRGAVGKRRGGDGRR